MILFDILFELFITFFKVGVFTFGGGYAMIPLITEEVIKKGWTENASELIDFIAISESTPGPFAVNISTFIGFNQAGVLGAIFASLGVIMPSFLIILFIASVFKKFADNKFVVGFLKGVKPVIVGVIFSVAVKFILKSVFDISIYDLSKISLEWASILIFVIVFAMTRVKKKIHPIYVVLVSGILGLLIYGLIL